MGENSGGRRALITGVTGQDGSYLAELLLAEGWRVTGMVRRLSLGNHARIQHLNALTLVEGDLLDMGSLIRVLRESHPDHIYHLAGQSFVPTSFTQPVLTGEVTGLGTMRMLEAMRFACPDARFYQASSSEMFGIAAETPQRESTPFHPQSPYAIAKVYAHHLAVHHREAYGLFVACGILFNHESPRRSPEFVTRKIAQGVAAIKRGRSRSLVLGNADARRDWGWAPDYVRAMYAMLSRDTPADWVVATGHDHSVREFAERAFAVVDLRAEEWLASDPALLRPTDIPVLTGDATRARTVLGWAPSIDFDGLVERMVRAEMDAE